MEKILLYAKNWNYSQKDRGDLSGDFWGFLVSKWRPDTLLAKTIVEVLTLFVADLAVFRNGLLFADNTLQVAAPVLLHTLLHWDLRTLLGILVGMVRLVGVAHTLEEGVLRHTQRVIRRTQQVLRRTRQVLGRLAYRVGVQ